MNAPERGTTWGPGEVWEEETQFDSIRGKTYTGPVRRQDLSWCVYCLRHDALCWVGCEEEAVLLASEPGDFCTTCAFEWDAYLSYLGEGPCHPTDLDADRDRELRETHVQEERERDFDRDGVVSL